ncbi:MAG: hypothetical protein FIB00_03550 [Chloroflexi bacterium]|nr:hypothetical protein [Dehalococcoidia bacterium]NJD64312.1 hypothetical protein [Chloroflexota bacterium]PWB47705.1 MAG: hypothetical protein C3F10_02410 [Dehalococcoidia bacterium]
MLNPHRCGHFTPGGIVGYPLERLNEEVAYLAYHFHWPPGTLMELEHRDRRLWVDQVADINRRLADAAQEAH